MSRLCGLVILLILSGCATVTTLPGKQGITVNGVSPIETVEISNTCWLFLTFLPVASGNPENPNGWDCSWFRDTVKLENQIRMLDSEAARVGASRALNVTTTTTDESLFFILFLRENIHTSATLVK